MKARKRISESKKEGGGAHLGDWSQAALWRLRSVVRRLESSEFGRARGGELCVAYRERKRRFVRRCCKIADSRFGVVDEAGKRLQSSE